MSRTSFFVFISITLFLAAGCASPVRQAEPVDTAVAGTNRYEDLLAAAKAESAGANFEALRLAYTLMPGYHPYLGLETALNPAMFSALQAGEFDKALEMAQRLLASNYVSIDGHYVAWQSFEALDNGERALHHRALVDGLLESISASGDGASTDSAYQVISNQEMYSFLGLHGMEPRSLSLLRAGKNTYNRVSAVDENNHRKEIYFDITLQVSRGITPLPD